jgi:hypothetical protein
MTLTLPRTLTSFLASTALAGALLAAGSGGAAFGHPASSGSRITGGAHLLAGDVRVWELTHGSIGSASAPMAGDVRAWDLLDAADR